MYQPPLVQACFHGDAAELRTLISRREDVNLQVNIKTFNLKLCKLIFSTLFCLIFVRAPEMNVFVLNQAISGNILSNIYKPQASCN